MKNLKLSIPGMQSAHCQARVNDVIKDIEGLKIEKLEAGKLSVIVDNEQVSQGLVQTIEKAGYEVSSEEAQKESVAATGCCSN